MESGCFWKVQILIIFELPAHKDEAVHCRQLNKLLQAEQTTETPLSGLFSL